MHLVHSVVLWACVAMFWILADMYVGPRACAFNIFQTSATSFDFVLGFVFVVHCTGFVVMFPIPMK